jgi:hypothetical protein
VLLRLGESARGASERVEGEGGRGGEGEGERERARERETERERERERERGRERERAQRTWQREARHLATQHANTKLVPVVHLGSSLKVALARKSSSWKKSTRMSGTRDQRVSGTRKREARR